MQCGITACNYGRCVETHTIDDYENFFTVIIKPDETWVLVDSTEGVPGVSWGPPWRSIKL